MDDLTATAAPLEVVWTIVTLIGLIVAARNTWNARQDLEVLRASGRNGLMRATQRTTLLIHGVITTSLLTKVLIGIMAMLSLPSMDPDGGASIAAMFAPFLMILSALALTFLSLYLNRNRRLMLEAVRDRYADPEHSVHP